MADYVNVAADEDSITVSFYIEEDKILKIGDKMNELVEDAYMNGYNWEAFLTGYLEQNEPDILDALEFDSEAGMCTAYIDEVNDETKELAERFAGIIEELIENEDELYQFLKENADEIEWD